MGWGQPALTYAWANASGQSDYNTPAQVGTDSLGNVYQAGYFTGSTQVGPQLLHSRGNLDIYLAKYTAQGQLLWVQQAGGPDNDTIVGMAVSATGQVVLTGNFDGSATTLSTSAPVVSITFGTLTLTGGGRGSELFVASYNARGQLRWAHQSQSPSYRGTGGQDVALDRAGNCYVSGASNGGAYFEGLSLGEEHFLAKLDSMGRVGWLRPNVGTNARGAVVYSTFQLAATPAGELYVLGQFSATLTLGSLTLSTAAPAGNYYLAKLDAQGRFSWARQDVLTTQESCRDLELTQAGTLVFTCEFTGTTAHGGHLFTSQGGPDVLVLSFSSQGDFGWAQQQGSSSPQQGSDQIAQLSSDAAGNLYTAWALDAHYEVVSYAPTGSLRWRYAVPRYVLDVAAGAPDELVFTGQLTGTAQFGSFSLQSTGNVAAYLAKLTAARLTPPPPIATPPATPPATPALVFIPNLITPNGDGRNDTFAPRGLPTGPWQLTIYSRWGTRLYSCADYQQDWAAPNLADGLYFYSLQGPGQVWFKGWLEVLR